MKRREFIKLLTATAAAPVALKIEPVLAQLPKVVTPETCELILADNEIRRVGALLDLSESAINWTLRDNEDNEKHDAPHHAIVRLHGDDLQRIVSMGGGIKEPICFVLSTGRVSIDGVIDSTYLSGKKPLSNYFEVGDIAIYGDAYAPHRRPGAVLVSDHTTAKRMMAERMEKSRAERVNG